VWGLGILGVCGVPTGRGMFVWGLPGISPQAAVRCPLWGKLMVSRRVGRGREVRRGLVGEGAGTERGRVGALRAQGEL
jgi:hypothetical protein